MQEQRERQDNQAACTQSGTKALNFSMEKERDQSTDGWHKGKKVTCYSHPAVRARIAEFLGMEPGFSKPTGLFLTIGDEHGRLPRYTETERFTDLSKA